MDENDTGRIMVRVLHVDIIT